MKEPTKAEQLAALASEIPEHLPPSLRVLVLVWRASLTMRYCPFLSEVATALGRSNSTITGHVAALSDDRMVAHLNSAKRVAITYAGAALAKIAKVSRDEKVREFARLQEIARLRGYKQGWVSHQYRARFGVWPVGVREKADH